LVTMIPTYKQSPLIYHTEKQRLVTLIPTIQTIAPNIPHRKTKVGNLDPNNTNNHP
jgi:hypothetical protein